MKGIFNKAVKEAPKCKLDDASAETVSDFKFDFDYHHPIGAIDKKKKKKRKKKPTSGKSDGNDDGADEEDENEEKSSVTDQSFSEYDTPIIKNLTDLISDNIEPVVTAPPGFVNPKGKVVDATVGKTQQTKVTAKPSASASTAPKVDKSAAVKATQANNNTTKQPSVSSSSGNKSNNNNKQQSKGGKGSKQQQQPVEDYDFDSMLSDFTKADLKNAPSVPTKVNKPIGGVFSRNNNKNSNQPKDPIRFLSPKDPELDSATQMRARYGNGKNLVAIGPLKVRDPNWSGSSSSSSGSVGGTVSSNIRPSKTVTTTSTGIDETVGTMMVGKMSSGNDGGGGVEPVLHTSVFSFSFGGL